MAPVVVGMYAMVEALVCLVIAAGTHLLVFWIGSKVGARRVAVSYAEKNRVLLESKVTSIRRISNYTKDVTSYAKGPIDMRDRIMKFVDAEGKKN